MSSSYSKEAKAASLDTEEKTVIKTYSPGYDIKLIAHKHEFRGHKAVLRTYSQIYKTLIEGDSSCSEIKIEDKKYKPETIDLYLRIIYSRAIRQFTSIQDPAICITDVEDLLAFAHYNHTELVTDLCVNKYIEDCNLSSRDQNDNPDRFEILEHRLQLCIKYHFSDLIDFICAEILFNKQIETKFNAKMATYDKRIVIGFYNVRTSLDSFKDRRVNNFIEEEKANTSIYNIQSERIAILDKLAKPISYISIKRKEKTYTLMEDYTYEQRPSKLIKRSAGDVSNASSSSS